MISTYLPNPISAIGRFIRLLRPDGRDIIHIYLYAVFAGLVTLTLPLGIQAILGLVVGGRVSSSLVILIAVVTLGTLFSGFLQVMQLTVTETIQRRLFARSSFEFTIRLPRLRLDSLQQEYPPELTNRFFDTLTIQKGLPKILVDLSTAVLQIFFGLLLISFYHPFFVFFGLALVLILVIIFRVTGPGGLRTSLTESKYKYNVAHWLQEMARVMTTFKLAAGSELALKRTDKLVGSYLDARGQHFRILLSQYWAIVGFKTLVTAVLLGLGSFLVMDNQISIGQFVAAEIVVVLILNSVEKFILAMDTIYDVLTGLEKIGQVTDLPLEHDQGLDFRQMNTGRGMAVSLHGVHFRFEDRDRPTLDGIDLDIAPGEKVCLSGYNGSGKTTLVQIISGLILNYRGSLTYNGIPAGNYNIRGLRRFIGDVGAQEDVFRGTLLENICLGHEEVDLQRVTWAVEQVGLDDFVRQLPKGYDTELLPGGRNLPQNVIVRILLARSIIAGPQLLALEEFLRQLEPADRVRLANLLTDRAQPWTLVAVSNDPLLAARCDRVVLLDAGRVVAQGTYAELQGTPHFRQIFQVPNLNGTLPEEGSSVKGQKSKVKGQKSGATGSQNSTDF